MLPASSLDTLSALPAFRALDRDALDRVASLCRQRRYRAGQPVFLEREPCRGFFAVHAGAVRLHRLSPEGREQLVTVARAGQSFAEAALFHFGFYPVNATAAATPTELLEVDGPGFLELFRSDDRLPGAMVGALCQRLLELVDRVDELSVVGADARLARALLRLPARGAAPPYEVRLPGAKRDLAARLAITPETLSRLLRRWREAGWIEVDGASVRLLRPEELERLAPLG